MSHQACSAIRLFRSRPAVLFVHASFDMREHPLPPSAGPPMTLRRARRRRPWSRLRTLHCTSIIHEPIGVQGHDLDRVIAELAECNPAPLHAQQSISDINHSDRDVGGVPGGLSDVTDASQLRGP